MSEAAAPAPGAAVAEAPAMGAEQQAALAEASRLRAEWSKAPSEGRDAIGAKISKLQRFAFGHGEKKPADFMPGDPPPPDLRPADSLRDTFEQMAQPATEQQNRAAVSLAALQGVDRGLAEGVGALCTELQLSESHTKAVLDRVRSHFGKDNYHEAADDIEVLDEAGIAEYTREATRILGSTEKLQAMRERAYAYVKSLGLESKYADLWQSSLGFDPKFLHTLAMAGVRRGALSQK